MHPPSRQQSPAVAAAAEWSRPGQVIRYYRRLKRCPDGRHWTQADLARARAVSMQSLCRRWPAWREKREQREQEDTWLQAGQM